MTRWTYEKAGVPHLKGDTGYNRKISALLRSTRVRGVIHGENTYASLFDLAKSGIRDPLIVSSTDGVGTKLELARLLKKHNTVGIDLVAMCVNDIVTCGAKPLFFLDYFSMGRFEPPIVKEVLQGITAGCRQADCALVGGETAIMPGMYEMASKGLDMQYDLAGFSVGAVDRKKVINGKKICPGDRLLGIASSGVHSNGFSLIRKIFAKRELKGPLGKTLLIPTRIYVRPVLQILRTVDLLGIAHITGGGFYDNLPRILPEGLGAAIDSKRWRRPRIFEIIRKTGDVDAFEMYRTFNMGIGMILVLRPKDIRIVSGILRKGGLASGEIGQIVKGKGVEIL
ncbi:MAG: phosphoribosylformylglycinamidine cyclo-ligase [Candidatus Omnitrophota bacterium]